MSKFNAAMMTGMLKNSGKFGPMNMKQAGLIKAASSGKFNALFLKNLSKLAAKNNAVSQTKIAKVGFNDFVKELKKNNITEKFDNILLNITEFFARLNFRQDLKKIDAKKINVAGEIKNPNIKDQRLEVSKEKRIDNKKLDIQGMIAERAKKAQNNEKSANEKKLLVSPEKISIEYVNPKIQNKEDTDTLLVKKISEIDKIAASEKTSSNNNSSKTSAPESVNSRYYQEVSEIFNLLVHRSRVMVSDNKSSIQMNLKSEGLGNMNLRLAVEDGNISGKILVDNKQTFDLLKTNINFLDHSFSESGFSLGNFEVSVRNNGRWNFSEDDGGRRFLKREPVIEESFTYQPQFFFYNAPQQEIDILI